MIKKIISLFFIFSSSSIFAADLPDLANMAQQLKGVAEQLQQNQPSKQTNQTPTNAPTAGKTSLGVTCFVSDSKNVRWATGDRNITSCDPTVIEGQITQPSGMVGIWQFLNDHEIVHAWIYSAQNRDLNQANTYTYERKGKKIIENVQGCMTPYEIVNETADSITIKYLQVSGKCSDAQIQVSRERATPSTYVKVKS
jgi:hypothetical protein